jgi:protein-tyrosine-phosphatase
MAAVMAYAEGDRKRILVPCEGNCSRSQLTEGFLESFDPRPEVDSAVTDPAPRVNPFADEAMKEVGSMVRDEIRKRFREFYGKEIRKVL